jgi:putative flippase GtrA
MSPAAIVARTRLLLQTRQKEVTRFLKFSTVGAVGAVLDLVILYYLHLVAGLPIVLANTCSFTAAVLSNFIWNRYWTYPDSRSKPIRTQLAQFFAVNIAGWGINTTILVLLLHPCISLMGTGTRTMAISLTPELLYKLGYNTAKAIATIVVLFWNFFINRVWTFSDVS